MRDRVRLDEGGKVYFKFLIWPSIILSILLTLGLNLVLHLFR
jgi:hypothetical protein